MALKDVTRESVLEAVASCDELGEAALIIAQATYAGVVAAEDDFAAWDADATINLDAALRSIEPDWHHTDVFAQIAQHTNRPVRDSERDDALVGWEHGYRVSLAKLKREREEDELTMRRAAFDIGLNLCSVCGRPAHPAETDEDERCADCRSYRNIQTGYCDDALDGDDFDGSQP